MPSLYLVQPRSSGGGPASAADINQLVNTLTGNQNTPVNVRNTDPIAYTFQGQNTDAAGKTLLLYGPDGTTVILRSQGNGVVASPDGTAAAPIVTTTHTQTLTGKTFTAPTLTNPSVSGPLTLTDTLSRIVPGATSLSLRNNANTADNLSISDAGVVALRNNLTLGVGASVVVPQPGGTGTFGLDANTGSVAVLNAGSLGVFGATNNFGGLLLVHDITNGEAALVLVAQTSTFLVFQSGTTFSVTGGAASKTSVYLTSGAVTIQNQLGATHNYQFLSLRSRGLA